MNEKGKELLKTFLTYVGIIVVVILIRIFLVDPVRVDGPSMNTTLKNGEILLLNKIVLYIY